MDNTNSKKISIIIPVFNVEAYLDKCLDSIIRQTMSELEIICVDDGSTDGSLEILRAYAQKDPRIQVIAQENRGVSDARNAGIAAAHGEYILFVDSDDWIEPETCTVLYAKVSQDKTDITLFNHTNINNGAYCESRLLDSLCSVFGERVFCLEDAKRHIFGVSPCVWNKIYRTAFLNEENIRFYSDHKIAEDITFWTDALIKARTLSATTHSFYFYRQDNVGSLIHRFDILMEELLYAYEKSRSLLYSLLSSDKAREYNQYLWNKNAAAILWHWKRCPDRLMQKKNYQVLNKFLRYSREYRFDERLRFSNYRRFVKTMVKFKLHLPGSIRRTLFSIQREMDDSLTVRLCGLKWTF